MTGSWTGSWTGCLSSGLQTRERHVRDRSADPCCRLKQAETHAFIIDDCYPAPMHFRFSDSPRQRMLHPSLCSTSPTIETRREG